MPVLEYSLSPSPEAIEVMRRHFECSHLAIYVSDLRLLGDGWSDSAIVVFVDANLPDAQWYAVPLKPLPVQDRIDQGIENWGFRDVS